MKTKKVIRVFSVVVCLLIAGLTAVQAAALKLSGTMPSEGDVKEFRISPDSQYVVYLANQLNTTATELYSVPITGNTPVRLNDPLQNGFSMSRYQISPLSNRVVFLRPKTDNGIFPYSELFSAPIDGSAPATKLNGPLVTGGSIGLFGITNDGQRVIYVADQDTDNVKELYRVPIDGSALPTKLNPTLVSGGNVLDTQFRLTPDGNRVVYVADRDADEIFELYSVPVTGPITATVKLNGALTSGGDVGYFFPSGTPTFFYITPDSSRVIYFADQDTDNSYELYSVPVDGSSPAIKLHASLTSGQTLLPYQISISKNSQKIAFTINQQVYVASIMGASSATSLHDGGILGSTIDSVNITPDSQFVIVHKNINNSGIFTLKGYRIPIAGPASAATFILESGPFTWSDDSRFMVYSAGFSGSADTSLYSFPLTGTQASAVKISDSITGLPAFAISPNSQRVVYRAGWLFSVPINGPLDAKYPLSAQTNNGGGVAYYSGFQISPNSRYVVYISDGDTLNKFELYGSSEFGDFPNKVYLPLVRR